MRFVQNSLYVQRNRQISVKHSTYLLKIALKPHVSARVNPSSGCTRSCKEEMCNYVREFIEKLDISVVAVIRKL